MPPVPRPTSFRSAACSMKWPPAAARSKRRRPRIRSPRCCTPSRPRCCRPSSDRHVPLEFERIVSHCLEKKAADRFQSARDLGDRAGCAARRCRLRHAWPRRAAGHDAIARRRGAAYVAGLAHAARRIGRIGARRRHGRGPARGLRRVGVAGHGGAGRRTPTPRARASRARGRSLAVLPFTTDETRGRCGVFERWDYGEPDQQPGGDPEAARGAAQHGVQAEGTRSRSDRGGRANWT